MVAFFLRAHHNSILVPGTRVPGSTRYLRVRMPSAASQDITGRRR